MSPDTCNRILTLERKVALLDPRDLKARMRSVLGDLWMLSVAGEGNQTDTFSSGWPIVIRFRPVGCGGEAIVGATITFIPYNQVTGAGPYPQVTLTTNSSGIADWATTNEIYPGGGTGSGFTITATNYVTYTASTGSGPALTPAGGVFEVIAYLKGNYANGYVCYQQCIGLYATTNTPSLTSSYGNATLAWTLSPPSGAPSVGFYGAGSLMAPQYFFLLDYPVSSPGGNDIQRLWSSTSGSPTIWNSWTRQTVDCSTKTATFLTPYGGGVIATVVG